MSEIVLTPASAVTVLEGSDAPATFAGIKLRQASAPPAMPWGICMAIYGPAGAGKTSWSATIADDPENGPVFDLDAEGGSRSIAHRSDVIVPEEPITSSATIDRFVQMCKRNCPWGSILMDNMSEYQDLYIQAEAGDGKREIQHYGAATANMLRITRTMRDLSRKRNVNVVLIAWDAPEKDEFSGITKRDVGFTPSLARQFPGIVDLVMFLEPVDKITRRLTLETSPRLATKFRRSLMDVAKSLPGEIYIQLQSDGSLKPSLADVVRVLKGKEKWDASKYPRGPQKGGQAAAKPAEAGSQEGK